MPPVETDAGSVLDRCPDPVPDFPKRHPLRDLKSRVAELTEQLEAARRDLAASDARLRTLLDAVPAVVSVKSREGHFLLANAGSARFHGRSVAEVEGRTPEELGVEAVFQRVLDAADREVRRTGRIQWVPGIRARCGGEERHYLIARIPFRHSDEHPDAILSVATDVTELKLAEAGRREGEELLRKIIDLFPYPVFVKDARRRYVLCNRAHAELLSRPVAEVIGKTAEEAGLATRNAERSQVADERVIAGGGTEGAEDELLTGADGRVRAFNIWKTSFRHAPGEPPGVLGIAVDVSDLRDTRMEIESQVASRTQELAAALRELEGFSYSVSHDLRAPVRAIAGFAGMLKEDHSASLPAEAQDLIGRISHAGDTMGKMVDGLLELAKLSRAEPHRRPLDLSGLAAEVWSEIVLTEPGRRVDFRLQGGCTARADPVLMRIVLQNLLSNAFKYTRRTADARVAFGREAGGGSACFYVRDNGAGFDMAYAGKLFGTFQRLHGAGEFEGTGVGLATAQRIVQRHGGRIWAEARLGEGATFRFLLGNEL